MAARAFPQPTVQYVDYEPRGAALALFKCKAPEAIMTGPANTGKSRGCLEKVNWCLDAYADVRGLMVRKTRRSLTQSGMITFEKKVLTSGSAVKFNTSDQAYRYPNGSVLAVAGIDDPRKIFSSEWDIVYVQQAEELDLGDWEAIGSRIRNGRLPIQQCIGDCNPDSPQHWIRQRAASKALVLLESRHEDNPTIWDAAKKDWTPKGLVDMAKLDALTGVRYRRLRLGQWATAEGAVYEETWDKAVHVIDRRPIPPEWPRYWAVDFGYTNPFVWQAWAEDPDGRLIRYREIYRTKTLVEDHARRIKEATKGEPAPVFIVCDHDAEDRATLKKHLDLDTVPAWKSVSMGIQAVEARLRRAGDGRPRLLLMRDSLIDVDPDLLADHKPTCTDEEVESYCFTAGTLVATIDGMRPLEEITEGDYVWTRRGCMPVLRGGMTQDAANVWTVRFSDGRLLTGTGNHPVFVRGKGWVPLQSISYSDIVETWENQLMSSCSTVSPIGVTLMPKGQTVPTLESFRQSVSVGSPPSTSTSGRPVMEMCQKGATSIMQMVIHSTTRMPTWSALLRRRMLLPIGGTQFENLLHGWRSWHVRGFWQRLFSRESPFGKGRENVQSNSGRGKRQQREPVRCAEKSSVVAVLWRSSFAPVPVDLSGIDNSGDITRSVLARIAESLSKSTSGLQRKHVPVHVLSVTAEERKVPVYNLTVAGVPEYYANGVLVHNCWDVSNNRKRGEEPVKRYDHGMDAMRYLVTRVDETGRDNPRLFPLESVTDSQYGAVAAVEDFERPSPWRIR